jgi:hypothetical protein
VSAALAVVAILALAVTVRAARDKPPAQVAQAPASPPAVKNVAPPRPEKLAPPPTVSPPAPPEPKVVAKAPEEKPAPPAPKAREKAAKRAEPAKAPATPAAPGIVAFAIAPWGEIIVDGKSQGVSPPLQQLQLSPGRHRIEVRNTGSTPHVQIVEVKSGEQIRIRHRFQ